MKVLRIEKHVEYNVVTFDNDIAILGEYLNKEFLLKYSQCSFLQSVTQYVKVAYNIKYIKGGTQRIFLRVMDSFLKTLGAESNLCIVSIVTNLHIQTCFS